MKNIYWFGILFGIASFVSTKGVDGSLSIFLFLFMGLGIAYVITMSICFKTKGTIHSLGHFAVFMVLSIIPFFINQQLEEMGGVLYFLIPAMILLIVTLGAIALFILSFFRKKGISAIDKK
ncbi:MAG: hypothetical protein WC637_23175 [Victivallales bacterium]